MKKILLTIMACVLSVMTWAQNPYAYGLSSKLSDDKNALSCILTTLSGIVICVKPVHPEKAKLPIVNTLSSKTTAKVRPTRRLQKHFGKCEWCQKYVPLLDLAHYGSILCCDDCATERWVAMEGVLGKGDD